MLDAWYVYDKYGIQNGFFINYTAGWENRSTADKASKKWVKENVPKSSWNDTLNGGVGDALRHCIWSCEMTQSLGQGIARDIGEMHERDNGSSASDMDQMNNQMGCFLGENNNKSCTESCLDNIDNLIIEDGSGQPHPKGPNRNW